MNLLNRTILIFILTALLSCQSNERRLIEQEQNVMAEIFPSLIDSMFVEITFSLRLPILKEIYDSTGKYSHLEPIEKGPLQKKEIIEELREYKKKSYQITIVLSDTIHKIDERSIEQFRRRFQNTSIDSASKKNNDEYGIDLSKYKADKVFNLIFKSEYKKQKHDPYQEIILSRISFSRLIFDKDKKTGMLTCEYICGRQCGNGYLVFIKKINNRWMIDKVEESWLA